MNAANVSGRVLRRGCAMSVIALALGGCASGGGGSPPGVEIAEPGAGGTRGVPAPDSRGPAVPNGASGPRTAPSSSLPIPSPGPSTAPRRYPGTPSAPGAVPGAADEPLAIEMERAPAARATGTAPTAADARLADPAHVPARSTNTAVNALLAQADGARRAGDLEAAVAAAERALRIAPSDPAVYYELAVLRMRQGDRARAEQLARKGLSYQPDTALRQRLEDLLARLRTG